jgi:hypothetical protein
MTIFIVAFDLYVDAANVASATTLARDAIAYVILQSGGDLYGYEQTATPREATDAEVARLDAGAEEGA